MKFVQKNYKFPASIPLSKSHSANNIQIYYVFVSHSAELIFISGQWTTDVWTGEGNKCDYNDYLM